MNPTFGFNALHDRHAHRQPVYQFPDFEEITDIWDVSRSSRVVLLVTFLATLTLEIQEAAFLGIVVSIMDFVYTSAQDIQVVELVKGEGGDWLEQLAKTETFEAIPQEDIFPATERLGQATEDAMAAAEQWLLAKTAID